MEQYLIEEFNPDLLPPNKYNYEDLTQGGCKIIVIGKPNSGKSTAMLYLARSKCNIIPTAVVMNGTEENTCFYSQYFPPLFVYNEYNREVLDRLIERQIQAKKEKFNPWTMLIIDDCNTDKKIFKEPTQLKLFKNGRHFNLFYILGLQNVVDLSTDVRNSVDGVLLFQETNNNTLKKLYDNFGGIFPCFEIFKRCMDSITGNYTGLFINNVSASSENWYEKIFYFKAPQNIKDGFKFGCSAYRVFGKSRIDRKFLDDINEIKKRKEQSELRKQIIQKSINN